MAALDGGDHDLAAGLLAVMRRRGAPPGEVVDFGAVRAKV